MAEYGITELGLLRVIHLSYELLGLQSFFTVGEDEVRAWTIRRGANAFEAAGKYIRIYRRVLSAPKSFPTRTW